MVYPDEAAAVRRVGQLIALGVWPGYYWSRLAGGWVLTYDPPVTSRAELEGGVLL